MATTVYVPAAVRANQPSRLLLLRIFLTVFLANMAILVLQVAAVRQLAPLVGNSLDTWTGIIGMFLAGICLGNALGGKLADRLPSLRTLRRLLWVSAAGSLSTILVTSLFHRLTFVNDLPLYPRIAVISFFVCFPSSFLLSLITPLAIRLSLPDVRKAGRIAGIVYAVGTAGSLVGTFLTGFVLLAYLNLNTIVVGTGMGLILLSLLAVGTGRKPIDAEEDSFLANDDESEEHLHSQDEHVWATESSATNAENTQQMTATSTKKNPRKILSFMVAASLIVSLVSFCSMVLEMMAPRLVAPHVGVSIYSFSAIVGFCLAGIALGNFVGGLIADLMPRRMLVTFCLLAAGLVTLGVFLRFHALTEFEMTTTKEIRLQTRVIYWAAPFFLPLLLMGMISPLLIRLAVKDVEHSGRTAGLIYSFSCLGALAGIFATGWLLISWLGVFLLFFRVGMALLVLAGIFQAGLLFHALFESISPVTGYSLKRLLVFVLQAAVFLICAATIGKANWYFRNNEKYTKSPFTLETNYYAIRVDLEWTDDGWVNVLALDNLVHSTVDPYDPNYLGYEHEWVQAEMATWVTQNNPDPHVLVIGGGGYTLPRWIESEIPRVSVEVVEIDPGVTEIAHRELGLSRDTSIKTWNMDGRQFVVGRAAKNHYDLIVQDAVNDLSVPFHLMTKEYNDGIRDVLKKDGIYLLTVIDKYKTGQLMRAAIRTLKQTFSEVHLLDTTRSWEGDVRSVYVIYASQRKLDLEAVTAALSIHNNTTPEIAATSIGLVVAPVGGPLNLATSAYPGHVETSERLSVALEPQRLQQYIEEGPQIILTDQYAPVDNLISNLYRER